MDNNKINELSDGMLLHEFHCCKEWNKDDFYVLKEEILKRMAFGKLV